MMGDGRWALPCEVSSALRDHEICFCSNRAGISKFELTLWGPLNAHNSGLRSLPELRIELPGSLQRGRGHEIGQKAENDIIFFTIMLAFQNSN